MTTRVLLHLCIHNIIVYQVYVHSDIELGALPCAIYNSTAEKQCHLRDDALVSYTREKRHVTRAALRATPHGIRISKIPTYPPPPYPRISRRPCPFAVVSSSARLLYTIRGTEFTLKTYINDPRTSYCTPTYTSRVFFSVSSGEREIIHDVRYPRGAVGWLAGYTALRHRCSRQKRS